MTELSPARAFNGLTDGVKGTAMPSFEALTTQDRWNLAFYIFTLRHDADAEARGAELADEKQIERMSTADLAGVGDGSLAPGVAAHDDAVAWLRGVAPYQTEERVSLAVARDGLDRALTALRAGDRVEARRLAGEAYLAGFEPHEESLRQAVPGQVARVEAGFLTVRAQIDDGASVAVVESEVRRTQALLDDAEASLGGARGAKLAFVGALLVVLREGLEAALLLLLLLGYAERQGAPAVRQVHAGWIAALGVGVLTWFASDSLIALAGARRELLEGGITLLAAGVLVTAHHWLVSAAEGRRRAAHIREQVFGGAAGRWTLTALAFGAVYREAFEVVLFLQAIALDGGTGTSAVLAGAAAAGVLLVGLVFAMLRLGRRVQAAPILKWAGILLCVMAVVFVGKGLRSLQEAGVVPIHSFGALRVGILGVFPTVETLGAQLALTLGLVASAWRPRWRRDEVDSRVAAK
jgi:high-affinity iron transporter